MALRFVPHGEDPDAIAGGDRASDHGRIPRAKARPVAFSAGPALGNSPASPPGEGKNFISAVPRGSWSGGDSPKFNPTGNAISTSVPDGEIENEAQHQTEEAPDDEAPPVDFLRFVREAESTSARYIAQQNRRMWTESLRAYNSQHFTDSKYNHRDWRNRSKFFRPKTRTAVKKDMAAVAASLFGNIDAVNCLPGNESDPRQRGAAAVMEELVNYRTDRSNGNAAMPWFMLAMGARQDALIAGVCLSKQSWKLELRKGDLQPGADGRPEQKWVIETDRPNCDVIPPENFNIDPAADWLDPIQSAAYVIIKWPMHLEEVHRKQENPISPWNETPDSLLLANSDSGTTDTSAIRRARELGFDRMDESQTGSAFQIVWVYEVYMRYNGEDYTFFSAGDRAYLTDPKPVREVYPEQFGQRPLVLGIGNLDAHRVFPMSAVASWQQHQLILNDVANLRIDAMKQNIMPVTKVVKGQGVDLDQVKHHTHGSVVMVQNEKDVTYDRPPDMPNSVAEINHEVELELDDLAGQFNGQTTANNNALSRTLGGLKLVSGAANAVQEFDIRVWIETWAQPTLAQVVRLEQYYEHDDVVLGLCGDRAQLFEKYGVSQITDDLIEQEITVRVSVGLGAGDPQQRLMKFAQVLQILQPVIATSPEFQRGEKEVNIEEVINYVCGAGGFRDGGARFFKQGQPKPQGDPLMDLKAAHLQSQTKKNEQTGKAAMITALAAAAKQALGERTAEADMVDQLVGRIMDAVQMGHEHGHRQNEMQLSAREHGHRHGMDIRQQGHHESMPQLPPGGGQAGSGSGAGGAGEASASPPQGGASPAGPPNGGQQGGPPPGPQPDQQQPSYPVLEAAGEPAPPQNEGPTSMQQMVGAARNGMEFIRDANNKIVGAVVNGQRISFTRGADGRIMGANTALSQAPRLQ